MMANLAALWLLVGQATVRLRRPIVFLYRIMYITIGMLPLGG